MRTSGRCRSRPRPARPAASWSPAAPSTPRPSWPRSTPSRPEERTHTMGLIGGMARTAVVAGTATAVSNRVSRRQANRWAQQDQSAYAEQQYAQPVYAQPQYAPPPQYAQPAPPAPAPAPASSGTEDMLQQLRE